MGLHILSSNLKSVRIAKYTEDKEHRDNICGGASVGLYILSSNLTSVGIAYYLKLLKSSWSYTQRETIEDKGQRQFLRRIWLLT